MKRKIAIFTGIIMVILFQTAFIPNLFSSESFPNIILILVVLLSSKIRLRQLWWYIIIAGVLLDTFLFFPLGTHTVLFLLLSLGVKVFERKLIVFHVTWRFFILTALIILCSIAYEAMLPAILHLARYDFPIEYHVNKLSLLYNVIFFAILYGPLLRLEYFLKSYYQGVRPKSHAG